MRPDCEPPRPPASRSPTSTAAAWSYPSSKAKAAATDTSCSRRSCSASCFAWKDYRHHGKLKVMTLAADEFMRRFLLHAVPDGFHRIRHVGFLANGHRHARQHIAIAFAAI